MRPVNFKEVIDEPMQVMSLFGVAGLFYDMRIDKDSVPEGLYAYDTRHGDDGDWCTPVTIEAGTVVVNFCGVFIADDPIAFVGQDYLVIEDTDLVYGGREASPRGFFEDVLCKESEEIECPHASETK